MSLIFSIETPDASAFKTLYDTTGWGPLERNDEFYCATLQASWASSAAYDADQLIGFARIISDGKLHAFITEMIVHPNYQRRGIGEKLIESLVARCQVVGINDIQLFCAKGKANFYIHCGFSNRPDDAPGMQYLGRS
jgi:ribosomal protein S18 acetylase RimI-like enzyme